MLSLFPDKPSVRIARLGPDDAKRETDRLRVLQSLIHRHEDMYPGIDKWVKRKVLPGLKSKERVAFVGYEEETPILSAVVRRGSESKFCHLRIAESFQDQHLGELLFSLMAREVRNFADEIHFTLPESLWEEKSAFFDSFGFSSASAAQVQYRSGERELICSSSFSLVWSSVQKKLPKLLTNFTVGGFGGRDGIILSLHQRNCEAILEGRKKIEVRKRFSRRWVGRRAYLYCTAPHQALYGEASIEEVYMGAPGEIWDRFNLQMGATKQEFDQYVNGSKEVSAIFLSDPQPYRDYITLSWLSGLLDIDLRPPQSYQRIDASEEWHRALSVAALLHRRERNSSAVLETG